MKRSHRQSIQMIASICELGGWRGSFDKLPANKTYALIIDYPIRGNTRFNIQTGKYGMGLPALLCKIGQAYNHIYGHAAKYGVWGHGVEDLGLDKIKINHQTKTIRLSVNS